MTGHHTTEASGFSAGLGFVLADAGRFNAWSR